MDLRPELRAAIDEAIQPLHQETARVNDSALPVQPQTAGVNDSALLVKTQMGKSAKSRQRQAKIANKRRVAAEHAV